MRIIICVNMSKNTCNILGAFRLASAKLTTLLWIKKDIKQLFQGLKPFETN